MSGFETIEVSGGLPIKAWTRGVDVDPKARLQLENAARLPIVFKWIAAMPDVHFGIGATVGSVIPTVGAIIPAAVGVDIGCGMMAVRTDLTASRLPDDLKRVRQIIEATVPVGPASFEEAPARAEAAWKRLRPGWQSLIARHGALDRGKPHCQLGTLGGGNHFIEVCLDETDTVWIMLHSGSRGAGNRIGTYFIERAKREMEGLGVRLTDADLAYLSEGSSGFEEYVEAVEWAQRYARQNREIMMANILEAMRRHKALPPFQADLMVVNCHHNYVAREVHYGESVLVTRKGAVRAGVGDLGIIPGSMGARSFIVRGKGRPESFESCSHGAGRRLSRTEAKRRFTIDDHVAATRHVECRKDSGVIDETPGAYKPIEDVMRAQSDLVDVLHTLRQVVCVKG